MKISTRYNPALLKLELLSLGLGVSDSAYEQMASKQKEPTMIRAGVGGSGIDLILEKEIWVNAPVKEPFAKRSPFSLRATGSNLIIAKNDDVIQKVQLVPQPGYYDRMTSTGIPMKRIGRIQGDFFAVAIDNSCYFWGDYEGEVGTNCKYCVIGFNKDRTEESHKTIDEVVEVYREALKEKYCRHISINAGAYGPPGRGHEIHAEYVRAIKENFHGTGSWVRICPAPPEDESYIDILLEAGADHLGYCYEIYDPTIYSKICPGKFKYIDKGVAHQQYDRMLKYAVSMMGRGTIHSNIIAGLEPKESTAKGLDHLGKMGVVPRVLVFRPLIGSRLQYLPPPERAELVYIYRKFKEIIEEKYGLDVFCPVCARNEVAAKFYLGIGQPLMPAIADDDLMKAGFSSEEMAVVYGEK